ncbi:hypothetical protein ACRAQ6_02960 [Erythrobacter sp. HA6-11]
MILRRITQHVRDQNWAAIAIDFVIVVTGVFLGIQIGNWNAGRLEQANYERALVDLKVTAWNSYIYAHERISIAACRKAKYDRIGSLLIEGNGAWPGLEQRDYAYRGTGAFPDVIRSPQRPRTATLWDTELGRGTYDLMTSEDRQLLASHFGGADSIYDFQHEMRQKEAALRALAYPQDLSREQRLHFFQILSEADQLNSIIELISGQTIESLPGMLLLRPNEDQIEQIIDILEEREANWKSVYGDCVIPFDEAAFRKSIAP